MSMVEGETPVPERVSPQPGAPECDLARARVGRFLRAAQTLAEDRELRAHLARCEPCNRHYRAELVRVSREQRERRSFGESGAEQEAALARSRRRSNFLRMLVPAIVIVAIIVQIGPPRPIGEVVAVEGNCRVGSKLLGEGDPARQIEAGQWLVTGAGSVARIEAGDGATLRLEPSTEVFVVEREPVRYMLGTGAVRVDGTCTLTTPFGAIEVREGAARVAVDEQTVEVEALAGTVLASNARFERTLHGGERARLSIDGGAGL